MAAANLKCSYDTTTLSIIQLKLASKKLTYVQIE